jgi:hypothetical protein
MVDPVLLHRRERLDNGRGEWRPEPVGVDPRGCAATRDDPGR